MAAQGGPIWRRRFLLFYCSVLAFFFSQNTVFCCPQDVAENIFDLPEEPSHSPFFPKMLCHSQINTQFGFFHSSPHLNQSSHPCYCMLTLPCRFDGQVLGPAELPSWSGWSNFLIGFIQTQECSKCSTFAERILSIIIGKKINKIIPWGLLQPSSRWESIVFLCFLDFV